jgi:hypothetical protein
MHGMVFNVRGVFLKQPLSLLNKDFHLVPERAYHFKRKSTSKCP